MLYIDLTCHLQGAKKMECLTCAGALIAGYVLNSQPRLSISTMEHQGNQRAWLCFSSSTQSHLWHQSNAFYRSDVVQGHCCDSHSDSWHSRIAKPRCKSADSTSVLHV